MTVAVIVTNMKKRYTGVSGTINALLPVQSRNLHVGFVGEDLPGAHSAEASEPKRFSRLSVWQALWLSRTRLADGRRRIWHVRRDPEMMLAIFLRDVLRQPIRIAFTSDAKHRHSWFPRWLISKMDGVIATTPEAAALVPNTMRVVFHGTSLTLFSPPPDKALAWAETGLPGRYGIGVFGRIRPAKGTDVFVNAMLGALPGFPEFTAVITGDCLREHADYKRSLEEKIRAHGLSDRIIFLGNLPAAEIPVWYQRVLIMVACPRYEPFGITPLEGMASGCAVVASATGAFGYLVEEGESGHIVPTGDANALQRRLEMLMSQPEHAAAMGLKGRQRVLDNYSIEKEAQGIEAVYRALWTRG